MRYKFGDIAENSKEKRMPTPDDKANYIGLEHLDTKDLEVHRYGSDVDITGQKLVMHKGDLLFGRRNTYLRRAAIAPHDGLFSAHGMILIPNKEIVDPDFFPFFILSDYFMDAAIRISVGSLSPTVNWSTLKDLEFDLPPMEEQREKAKLLWGYERMKRAYKQLLSCMDILVKSQFVEMFGGSISNPMGWPSCKIGEIYDVKSSKRIYANELTSNGIPFLKVADVLDRIATGESHPSAFIPRERYQELSTSGLVPQRGDIILTSRGTIGKCYIITDNDEFYFQDGMISWLQAKPNCNVLPEFLVALFSEAEFVDALDEATNKTTVTYISLDKLADLQVITPPESEQRQYLSFVVQTDKSKLAIQQALDSLEKSRSAIMKQIFG